MALGKHIKADHGLEYSGNKSILISTPRHSTCNNSVNEGCIKDDKESIVSPNKRILNVIPQIEHISDQIKFTCVECDYKTKTKSSIERHVKSIHEPDTRDVQMICGICTHEFILEEDYNIHVKTHDAQESHASQTNPTATLN